jgi:uncharacterized protein (DUF934 family)
MALAEDALLYKDGRIVPDGWLHLEDADPFPANASAVTISWARWLAERDMIDRAPSELGVRVANTVAPDDIGADAERFGLITVHFPSFGDGRAYSQARVLRDRHRYRGEIRATGDVLRDQLLFMKRVGIDAFEVPERAVRENWFAAFGEYDIFYQQSDDDRPWIARLRLRRN